jgi:hypothetical protein
MNDMWRYNGYNWTLLSLPPYLMGYLATPRGEFSASNFPPIKSDHALWVDPVTNLAYIFGGESNGEQTFNFFCLSVRNNRRYYM